jgi:hypothetical protein
MASSDFDPEALKKLQARTQQLKLGAPALLPPRAVPSSAPSDDPRKQRQRAWDGTGRVGHLLGMY